MGIVGDFSAWDNLECPCSGYSSLIVRGSNAELWKRGLSEYCADRFENRKN